MEHLPSKACRRLLFNSYPSVLQTHSNETVGNIRWKISEHLSCPVDNVQIFANDSVVRFKCCVPALSSLVESKFLPHRLRLLPIPTGLGAFGGTGLSEISLNGETLVNWKRLFVFP